jgi:hypothetical protein
MDSLRSYALQECNRHSNIGDLKKILSTCDEKRIRDDEKYWKSVQQNSTEAGKNHMATHLRVK